jgi:hypothetical protein
MTPTLRAHGACSAKSKLTPSPGAARLRFQPRPGLGEALNRRPEVVRLHVCLPRHEGQSPPPAQLLHCPEIHPGHHEATGERMPAGMSRYPIEAGRVHLVHFECGPRPLDRRRKELRGISGKAGEDRLLRVIGGSRGVTRSTSSRRTSKFASALLSFSKSTPPCPTQPRRRSFAESGAPLLLAFFSS